MRATIVSAQPAKRPMPRWTDEPFVGKANAVTIHSHTKSEARALLRKYREEIGSDADIRLVRKL